MGSTITIVYLRSIERIHLRGRECFLRIDTLITQVGVLVFLFSENGFRVSVTRTASPPVNGLFMTYLNLYVIRYSAM